MTASNDELAKWLHDSSVNAFIIDADDTLWYDSMFFRELRGALVQIATNRGVSDSTVRACLRDSLQHLGSGELGFIGVIKQVASAVSLQKEDLALLDGAIWAFLNHPITLLPYAYETLASVSRYRKILFTKGREEEQLRKLELSGLAPLLDRVSVVPEKNETTLRGCLSEWHLNPDALIFIGNSVKHDIIPAVRIGANAVWLDHEKNYNGRSADLPLAAVKISGWKTIYDLVRA